jgi:flagellar hook-basal body complex protein FliE
MKLDSFLEKTGFVPVDIEQKKGLNTNGEGNGYESSFFSYLKDALQEVDGLQKEATKSAQMLALGDEDYLHNTMIAYEKASLALQLTIEVRDKIVEAYQEIMRIQM